MELIHAVWKPAGERPHPTIIAFHGWGANALDLLGLAPYLADGRFMVICPQGATEVPIGPIRGYGWFQLMGGARPRVEDVDASIDQCERFIEAAVKAYAVDVRKLVVLGFSQGGVIAYNLALRSPSRFAALVALSSWFPPELSARVKADDELMQLPTMIQHGRADEMIEISRARESLESLRVLKIPVVYREYDGGHEITADGLADLSQFLNDKVLHPIVAP